MDQTTPTNAYTNPIQAASAPRPVPVMDVVMPKADPTPTPQAAAPAANDYAAVTIPTPVAAQAAAMAAEAVADATRIAALEDFRNGYKETIRRLQDSVTTSQAEATRWRKVAGELAGALRKELFEAVNCWVHHDGESPEGSAEPEHIIQGRAALTRFKQEGGQ